MTLLSLWQRLERTTRPVHPVTARALAQRWAALPPGVRTEQQILGRHAVGCEGTHGVFPKCDLTCSPCYHSKDANKVRVDGAHTVAQVEAQMSLLEATRGPRAHAQLIGGEVSLLDPEDHAAALAAMRKHGREPMSMSHGDFTADYLRAVALDETGQPRFGRLSFAAAPVVALDVPSGVDATTGDSPGAHVRAAATMTLALPRPGSTSMPSASSG